MVQVDLLVSKRNLNSEFGTRVGCSAAEGTEAPVGTRGQGGSTASAKAGGPPAGKECGDDQAAGGREGGDGTLPRQRSAGAQEAPAAAGVYSRGGERGCTEGCGAPAAQVGGGEAAGAGVRVPDSQRTNPAHVGMDRASCRGGSQQQSQAPGAGAPRHAPRGQSGVARSPRQVGDGAASLQQEQQPAGAGAGAGAWRHAALGAANGAPSQRAGTAGWGPTQLGACDTAAFPSDELEDQMMDQLEAELAAQVSCPLHGHYVQ